MNSSEFLGVGWSFPVRPEEQGDGNPIVMAVEEESVRQAMWMILGTAPGERMMRPDFGCGIHNLVFAPNTAGTAGQIITAVTDALTQWEPRIDVLNVDVVVDPEQPNRLLIDINYQIRRINNRFNLVYPFYLEY